MCTVSFVPQPDGFLLTTNRDERRERGEATPPVVFSIEGRRVCAPRDQEAGGTWVLVTERGVVLCLLNGSVGPYEDSRPGAPSRGLLVPRLAVSRNATDMHRTLQRWRERGELVHNTFRLLVVTREEPGCLTRLSWDGERVSRETVRGPHVETSSGFDAAEAHRRRDRSFRELLPSLASTGEPATSIWGWHSTHLDADGIGDPYSVCMHHEVARTVSSTQVEVTAERIRMSYRPGNPCRKGPVVSCEL